MVLTMDRDDRTTVEPELKTAPYFRDEPEFRRSGGLRTVGPNGGHLGYTEDGDKAEWLVDDRDPDDYFAILLRRNDVTIRATYLEFRDKVWWNRHQNVRHKAETGEIELREGQLGPEIGCAAAARIEEQYGLENLGWDGFDWGLLSGRMSALAWVLGAEWEESLDT